MMFLRLRIVSSSIMCTYPKLSINPQPKASLLQMLLLANLKGDALTAVNLYLKRGNVKRVVGSFLEDRSIRLLLTLFKLNKCWIHNRAIHQLK